MTRVSESLVRHQPTPFLLFSILTVDKAELYFWHECGSASLDPNFDSSDHVTAKFYFNNPIVSCLIKSQPLNRPETDILERDWSINKGIPPMDFRSNQSLL